MLGTTSTVFVVACLLLTSSFVYADGFQLRWAIEHEPHLVLHLTPEQIATVGRERKLILTDSQHENLRRYARSVPRALGVESLGEPDCGCCISSALWTATDQVTIWTERLARDKDGSKAYFEVRLKEGHYTADAEGRLYLAGRPVTWKQFESAVKAQKADHPSIQLSLPPTEPRFFAARVRRLKEKYPFFYRL